LEKPNREKKQIKILKKPTSSIRFRFYKPDTKKIEPNKKNRAKPKKPSQTGLSWFLSKKTEPKPVGLNRFRFGFGFFKKNSVWLFFFIKTEPNRK
jgi:hypothetical protein